MHSADPDHTRERTAKMAKKSGSELRLGEKASVELMLYCATESALRTAIDCGLPPEDAQVQMAKAWLDVMPDLAGSVIEAMKQQAGLAVND